MTQLLPATSRALLHDLATGQASDRQPSVVAGVVREGELVWSAGRGDVDDATDTQYRIGSLTKTMTAVLVLQCRDEGLLSLDDPVSAYVPTSPWPDTPLRLLLGHAGGLPAEPPGPWWERHGGGILHELVAGLDGQPLALPAGSAFHYSNVGYALLGAVVEGVRGGTWWDVLRTRVLRPLGMSRTTYGPRPPYAQGRSVHPWSGRLDAEPHTDTGAMAPAGQLWSTVADLARWASFWLAPDPAVLDAATAEQMHAPTVALATGAWGLGLSLDTSRRQPRFGHGGSMPGFVARLEVDPAERTAAVSLANATIGGGELAATLLDTVYRHEPALPQPWTPEPELSGTDELLGPWYWGNTTWTLLVRGGALQLDTASPTRDSRFVPAGPDRWRGQDAYFAGELLRVVRDLRGAIDHLDLASYVLRRRPYA